MNSSFWIVFTVKREIHSTKQKEDFYLSYSDHPDRDNIVIAVYSRKLGTHTEKSALPFWDTAFI